MVFSNISRLRDFKAQIADRIECERLQAPTLTLNPKPSTTKLADNVESEHFNPQNARRGPLPPSSAGQQKNNGFRNELIPGNTKHVFVRMYRILEDHFWVLEDTILVFRGYSLGF